VTTAEKYLAALMKADAAAIADKTRREESRLGPPDVLESETIKQTKVSRPWPNLEK
jgi:hypothetical protein